MSARILGPRGSTRRRRFVWIPLLAVTVLALLFAASAAGVLNQGTPFASTFEAQDGDLAVNDGGTHDWNTPVETINCGTTIPTTGTNCGTDLAKSGSDNAFGQGSKEDIVNPTVVFGSIPPNKSDLTRFYINKEQVGTHHYVYLAWERSNVLGTANMDFELDQNQCVVGGTHNTCDPNGVTAVRVNGDLLVTYDFENGGARPSLHTLRWLDPNSGTGTDPYTGSPLGTGKDLQCFSSNAYPCWGDQRDITAAGLSEGGINTANVVDTNPPLSGPTPQTTLPGLTFGEAGLDLDNIGVFSSTACEAFGSAFLKSRSSTSFPSEIKDFIAPVPINITNCGTVKIHKQDDAGAPLAGAVFTLFTDAAPVDGSPPHGAEDTATALSCTTGADGDCTISNVPFGNYWAVETTGVPNHDLAADQSFSLTLANSTITLTFVDPRQFGAILVTKTAKNKNLGSGEQPLAGATFTIGGVQKTTDANGQACFDNLAIGTTYTVTENSAPTGYSIDNTSKDVTVDHAATCAGSPNTVSFTDKPLTTITVNTTSLAGAGVTTSTVQCSGEAAASDADAGHTTAGLPPGTYTCTVIIDP
jgi:uncharacterized surface anchored protein